MARRSVFSGIEQRVVQSASSLDLPPGSCIIIGFSGGPDSLCLAAVLSRIARSTRVAPILAHVDHRLRPGSAADAESARRLAAALGVPFELATLPDELTTIHPGVGLEEAARRERYLALARIARSYHATIVALGHHLNDQAETVLLHLMRGAGAGGLGGMRPLAELRVPWWRASDDAVELRVWRPLLGERKVDIDAYVARLELAPIQDESNGSDVFTRNAIRHHVIPAMQSIAPATVDAIWRAAEIASIEADLVASLAADAYAVARSTEGALDRQRVRDLHPAIQRRVMLRWLREATSDAEIPFDRVLATIALLRGEDGPVIEIAGDVAVTLIGAGLYAGTRDELIRRAWQMTPAPRPRQVIDGSTAISVGESVISGGVRFRLERVDTDEPAPPWRSTTIPAAAWPFQLRALRPGDRWAANDRQVNEQLRRARVPVLIRGRLICLASDSGIEAIPGIDGPRIQSGDRFRLSWIESD